MTKRIAMWSGPRNISTAMMRSWENRSDCEVIDEPFYAYYLQQTQSPHPMFDEIVASQSSDFKAVAQSLSQRPSASLIQYQKHMTHHMLDHCDLSWTKHLSHCFLIRDPAFVVNSYTNSRGECNAQDIGIKRQYELYEAISAINGRSIPVVDSVSVLQDPKHTIQAMCEALGISFTADMLSWPAGTRDSDGIWSKHWYRSVEGSTGFAAPKTTTLQLNTSQLAVVEEVMPYYLKMKAQAI